MCMSTVAATFQGAREFPYLDDSLLAAPSMHSLVASRDMLLEPLRFFDITVNLALHRVLDDATSEYNIHRLHSIPSLAILIFNWKS